MAGQRSKRRARKRRRTAAAPRAVPSQRREHRTAREVGAREERQRGASRVDRRGERPPSPFGGVPVSEIAIFAGLIAVLVGYLNGGGPALAAGIVLCGLGVIEVTAREHFSGFRSHTILLAAIPTVAVEYLLVQILPTTWPRETALIGDAIVFGLMSWLLRGRWLRARQARVARPRA